jgi:hypothetical protein
MIAFHATIWLLLATLTHGYSKNKPHSHPGQLTPYDGHHLKYNITAEQLAKLQNGLPVLINERSGKSGRGIVIQDVHASPSTCMQKISDLEHYHIMVPNVKKVEVYSNQNFENGTVQVGAQFNVGISIMTFGYYLLLTFEPKYNTYTWVCIILLHFGYIRANTII